MDLNNPVVPPSSSGVAAVHELNCELSVDCVIDNNQPENDLGTPILRTSNNTSPRLIYDVNLSYSGAPSKHVDSNETVSKQLSSLGHSPIDVLFRTEPTPDGNIIEIYPACVIGSCTCAHVLDHMTCQLKPCQFAVLMCDANAKFLYDGDRPLFQHLTDGFPIVEENVPTYDCKNYLSILCDGYKEKMDIIIQKELAEGMITRVVNKPHCIHALGAVPKPDGGLHPITDCSRPVGSVNHHCDSIVSKFHYVSVDSVTDILRPGEFMAIVDIKSAYRAVAIHPNHRTYVGFRWYINDEECFFVDNRLCFGLKSGP